MNSCVAAALGSRPRSLLGFRVEASVSMGSHLAPKVLGHRPQTTKARKQKDLQDRPQRPPVHPPKQRHGLEKSSGGLGWGPKWCTPCTFLHEAVLQGSRDRKPCTRPQTRSIQLLRRIPFASLNACQSLKPKHSPEGLSFGV